MKRNNRKLPKIFKIGFLFLGISLFLWNCEETSIDLDKKEILYESVSKNEIKDIFLTRKKNNLYGKNAGLTIEIDWNSFKQEELDFTDALLSNVEAKLNVNLDLKVRLVFIKLNGKLFKAIETQKINAVNSKNEIKNGKVYYHRLDGTFLDAYVVENGLAILRLIPKPEVNKASFLSFDYLFQECNENLDPNSTFCDDDLDGFSITVTVKNESPPIPFYFVSYFESLENNEKEDEIDTSAGGGGGSQSENNTCIGGKTYNSESKLCECPEGTVENIAGVCVDSPTPCESALLARDVYNIENGQQEQGTEPISIELSGNWVLNNTLDLSELKLTDNESGFNSAVYQKLVNGIYHYMYVTEGSTFEGLQDWVNNANQLFGNSKQYQISTENAKILNRIVGPTNRLFFSGHSLGGGLASCNALVTGRSAFTYNAAGLSDATKKLYNFGLNPSINATVVKGEILDKLQSKFGIKAEGKIKYIEEESGFWEDFFNERSPALNTYKSMRLHMINAIIDILECE